MIFCEIIHFYNTIGQFTYWPIVTLIHFLLFFCRCAASASLRLLEKFVAFVELLKLVQRIWQKTSMYSFIILTGILELWHTLFKLISKFQSKVIKNFQISKIKIKFVILLFVTFTKTKTISIFALISNATNTSVSSMF